MIYGDHFRVDTQVRFEDNSDDWDPIYYDIPDTNITLLISDNYKYIHRK